MGSYKPEWEDYNPVTDRWTRGPMKYVEDEEDKQRAYETRQIDSESKDIERLINNIKSSDDYEAIKKAEDAIEDASYLDKSQKLFWRRELNARIESWKRFESTLRENAHRDSAEKRTTKDNEHIERVRAMEAAKSRYDSLSFFGKLKNFKHRPSKIDIYHQTSQEIDGLYRRR